jgi:hypothetical protein
LWLKFLILGYIFQLMNGRIVLIASYLVMALTVSAQHIDTLRHRQNIAVGISHVGIDSIRIHSVDIGPFANVERLKGMQLGFLTANVYKEAEGVNAGILAATSKYAEGLQISGVGNLVFSEMKGVQMSSVLNAAKHLHGVQVATFSNVAGEDVRGAQLSGIANIAVSVSKGVQMASIFNMCVNNMHGWQLANFNVADTLSGSQIGIFNMCSHHPHGVQIGIINYSRDTVAHKIGLVNVNPKTRIQMMIYGGTCTKANVAVRFRNRSTYNVIGLGTHYMGLDKKFSGALFYRVGQYFHLASRWTVSGDVGYYHIETFRENSDAAPERMMSIQARVNLDYQLTSKLGMFGSVGYGDTRKYGHLERYKNKMLFELGFTLF